MLDLSAAQPAGGAVAALHPGGANISVIPFSTAVPKLPRGLSNLLRDIFTEWKDKRYLDTREPLDHTTTSNRPGSIRSYHMNQKGSLPLPITPAAGEGSFTTGTPANKMGRIQEGFIETRLGNAEDNLPGRALHYHYKATSSMDSNAVIEQPGGHHYPVGYVEYTGIGFGGEPHDCKIIFNYLNGDMYLTLTHYQYYTITGEGVGRTFSTDGDGPGDSHHSELVQHNPWFKINMRA